jgi:hypothetical protein
MKFLNLLFVLTFVFAMASCGGNTEATEATTEATEATATEEPAPAPVDSTAQDTTKKAEAPAH